MKRILGIALIALVTGCAHAPQQVHVDLQPAIAEATTASKDLDVALKSDSIPAKNQAIVAAKKEVEETKASLLSQQVLAQRAQEQIDFLTNKDQQQEKLISQLKEKVSHFDKLLFILSGLIGVIVAFVIGSFAMRFSPYGALIGIGSGVAASGASWGILSHL